MKTSKRIFLLLLVICTFTNCTNDSEDDLIEVLEEPETPDGETPEPTLITYTDDIEPIMRAACVTCHGSPPTNGAPFPLINFTQVSQTANGIFNRMSLSSGAPGAMPPSGRLPQSTIDLVEQWIEDGTPEN